MTAASARIVATVSAEASSTAQTHSVCDAEWCSATTVDNMSMSGKGFQLDWSSGHAMRLNSRTGIEGPPVSSLNCDTPLHSGLKAP